MTVAVGTELIKVQMARIGYGKSHTDLETLLGSCVGIAVWDRISRCSALAHVLLPDSGGKAATPGKFADTAIIEMKSKLISAGANPRKFVAKIAGGARMFGKETNNDIGARNCEAVRDYLKKASIPIIAEHVGGTQGRIIRFSSSDSSLTVSIAGKVITVI